MTKIYKWVHIYLIDEKVEEIEQTPANEKLLKMLEKSGEVVDVGSRRVFVQPNCPNDGQKMLQAEIRGVRDESVGVKLYCSKCRKVWEQEEV